LKSASLAPSLAKDTIAFQNLDWINAGQFGRA
jgi:hypothetical protein